MPKPTLENRNHFKQYLRHFRKKFDSDIQTLDLEHIRDMMGQEDTSLADNTPVKVVLFDNFGTVDISTEVSNNDYVYFPALAGDRLTVEFSSNSYDFTFEGDEDGLVYNDTTYTFNDKLIIGGKQFTVKGLGGVLLETENAPTYTATPNVTSINEGSSVTITLTTADTGDATYYYTVNTVSGSLDAADFTTPLTGSFTTVNNTATITLTTSEDFTTEGVETFTVQIRTDSITGNIVATTPTITINDTSLTATYAVAPDVTSVNEGDTVTFTVTTANVPDGTLLYYSTTGAVEAADFTDNSLVGSLTINSDTATITRTLENDLTLDATEGSEDFAIEIRTTSITGTVRATSSTVTVADTSSASYTSTISSTQSAEETTLTIDVSTVGIPDGYTLYYSTSGVAATTTDLNSVSGSFVINSGTGTFDIDLLQDYIPDDGETFTVNIRTGSTSGAIVDTIGPITVDDTPFILTATPSVTIIDESTFDTNQTLTITIDTVNVPDGTSFTAEVRSTGGTVNSSDLSPFTTSLTISNNTSSYDIALTRDALTEGLETFVVDIKKGGATITSTPTIAITDKSYIGSRADGLTFGPMQVNRDEGVALSASDWYTLCNLERIPNGSKVAIFIDESGSMTMSTIAASYQLISDKLTEREISFITVTNSNEDWITPFDVELD